MDHRSRLRLIEAARDFRMPPQLRKIVNHCAVNDHITGDAAITYYRIMALPRRIADLKARGFKVVTERRSHPVTGQRYMRYRITGAPE